MSLKVMIQPQTLGKLRTSLTSGRAWPSVWVSNDTIFAANGGIVGPHYLSSIEKYDPVIQILGKFGT